MTWIDITTAQPELDQCVIIGSTRHEFVGEARYIKARDGMHYFVSAEDESKFAMPPPTHWIPLPESPKLES